jgi:rhodanese-related sulfurtransferase
MSAHRRPHLRPVRLAALALGALAVVTSGAALSACGDDDATPTGIEAGAAGVPTPDSPVLLGPAEAQAFLASPPAGLVVLDVRTPEEFAEGHLADAQLLDFQSPTFAADVAELDRDLPIFVYCRSGNRSAQAVATMVDLGFTNLSELDGGVVAWQAAGSPLVTG